MGCLSGLVCPDITRHSPFNPACFSPCLPKPKVDLSRTPNSPASAFLPPNESRKDNLLRDCGAGAVVGSTPFFSARQAEILRLGLADSRKTRPSTILRQPTEKRRNAATRVKSSTWCDSTVAPILQTLVRNKEV